jgi:hypothetical protein
MSLHFKEPEKYEQTKAKASRRKEAMKIRCKKMNQRLSKQKRNSMKPKVGFLKRSKKNGI